MIGRMRKCGVAALMLGASLLTGCAPSVVGKWSGSMPIAGKSLPMTMEFKKDNTFTQSINASALGQFQASGPYNVEKDNITMSVNKMTLGGKDLTNSLPPQFKNSMEKSGTFKVEGDKMTLTSKNGDTFTLARVKE